MRRVTVRLGLLGGADEGLAPSGDDGGGGDDDDEDDEGLAPSGGADDGDDGDDGDGGDEDDESLVSSDGADASGAVTSTCEGDANAPQSGLVLHTSMRPRSPRRRSASV